jgi:tetratricopeptide (TPR) repeat protein/glycosyltransferase involved in cell wall biosynthesis
MPPVITQVNDTEITLTIANQLRESNRLDEAIAAYQILIQSQTNNAVLYDLLGQTQAQKNDLDSAIANYQKALELGLDNPFWTYKNLGDALGVIGRLEEAIVAYQKAIELNNRNPYVCDSLAQIQARQGNFDRAIVNYRQAIELGLEQSFWTYKNLGEALNKLNRWDEAIAAYKQAMIIDPDRAAFVYCSLGQTYALKGDTVAAVSSYQKALSLNPQQPAWVYKHLSQLLEEQEENNYVEERCTAGERLLGESQIEAAISAYEQALLLNPTYTKAYIGLGNIFRQQERWKQAIDAYKKAIELQPSIDGHVYEYLGEALSKFNNAQSEVGESPLPTPSENVVTPVPLTGEAIDEATWHKTHAGNLRRLREEFQFCERAFILGDDFQLDADEIELLRNEVTFAFDRSLPKLEALGFTPTFYLVEDKAIASQNQTQTTIWSKTFKLIPRNLASDFPRDSQTIFFNHAQPNTYPDYREFSTDATRFTYTGITTAHTCLQLACYLNFRQIYTIGVAEHNPIYREDLYLLEANNVKLYNASIDSEFQIIPPVNYYDLFPQAKVYPRLLIIDMTRMGGITATGQIKTTLFAQWPQEDLLQVYSRSENGFGLYSLGSFIEDTQDYTNPQEVLEQCRRFQPDLIYYRPVADRPFLDAFAQNAIEQLQVPVITHIMDDWPDRLSHQNPELASQFNTSLKSLLDRSAARLSICEAMSRAFQERYGLDFIPVANCIDIEEWIKIKRRVEETKPQQTGFTLRYVGGLADDMNFTSIQEIARGVAALHSELKVRLEIYTMPHWKEKAVEAFGNLAGVSIHDSNLPPNDYAELLASSDALIVSYNFDPNSIRYVRYSMANKLPECMAAGVPLLIYGPIEVATVAYAVDTQAVIAVTDRDTLKLQAALKKLVLETDECRKLAQKARQFAFACRNQAYTRSQLVRICRKAVSYSS